MFILRYYINTREFRKLKNYKLGSASAIPFTTTLTELMGVKV